MTKPELIDAVSATTGQTKADTDRTLEAILEKAADALAHGQRVELRGFGIFEAKQTKARTGRNPATGATIEIPASRKASFRPSKELKNRLSAKQDTSKEQAHAAETQA